MNQKTATLELLILKNTLSSLRLIDRDYKKKHHNYVSREICDRIKTLRGEIKPGVVAVKKLSRTVHGQKLISIGADYKEALKDLRGKIKDLRISLKEVKEHNVRTRVLGYTSDIKRVGGLMTNFTEIRNYHIIRSIFEDKKPKDDTPHVGIEVECVGNISKDDLAKALLPLKNYLTVKHDGSLKPYETNHKYAYEIVACIPESRMDILKELCDILKKNEITVNKTCGLHIHLDARAVTNRNHETMFTRLSRMQGLLLAMQPESRRNNRYCKRNTQGVYHASRYVAVNARSYLKHGTIEVRCHSGTVEYAKISNWITLCLSIIDNASVDSLERFRIGAASIKRYVPAKILEYVIERVKKFRKGE